VKAVYAWVPKRSRGPQERPSADAPTQDRDRASSRLPPSPYADQYETVVAHGETRPAPSLGVPALTWHVAIWPRRTVLGADGVNGRSDPYDTAGQTAERAHDELLARRALWLQQVDRFLEELQARSHKPPPRRQPKPADVSQPTDTHGAATVCFTLWWNELIGQAIPAPDAEAIRVHVMAEVSSDYAAFGFYMDIGAPAGPSEVQSGTQSGGQPGATGVLTAATRRERLRAAVDDIRRICDFQLGSLAPGGVAADAPALPEFLQSPDHRTSLELQEALKAHRNLLYVDIWEAFAREMDCRLEDIAGERGEVFANSRGLVMTTGGLPSATLGYTPLPQRAETAQGGADLRFGANGAEADALVRAYWPLVRWVTPRTEARAVVASGLADWRALHISALGAQSQVLHRQDGEPAADDGEAAIRVPLHLLADDEKHLAAVAGPFDSQVHKRAGAQPGNNHPVRYLLLTKPGPDPRTVGHIAERLDTIATRRLYGLKDWAAVRDVDAGLPVLARDLDEAARRWGEDRRLLGTLAGYAALRRAKREMQRLGRTLRFGRTDAERQVLIRIFKARDVWSGADLARLRAFLPAYIPGRPPRLLRLLLSLRFLFNRRRYRELLYAMERDTVANVRLAALQEICAEAESDLGRISAALAEAERRPVGGLQLRVERSARCARELDAALKALRVARIPGWTSYEEFAERRIAPAFDLLQHAGQAAAALRARLQGLTEAFEASLLVAQSEATRQSAAALRRSATLALVLLFLFLAATSDAAKSFAALALARLGEVAVRLIAAAHAWLPGRVTSWIDQVLAQVLAWLHSL
jgi:hypothetical protein